MAKKKRINIDESDLRKSKVWAAEPSASPEYVKNVIQALQEIEESDDPKAATRGLVAALARAMGIESSSEKVPPKSKKGDVDDLDPEIVSLLKSEKDLKSLLRYVGKRLRMVQKKISEGFAENEKVTSLAHSDNPSESVIAGSVGGDTAPSAFKKALAQEEVVEVGEKPIVKDVKRFKNDLVMGTRSAELCLQEAFSPVTGRSMVPDTSLVGPSGFQITWRALCNVMALVFGMALPMARIEKLFGTKGFSRSSLTDYCAYIAQRLLPVYVAMAEELAQCEILMGDDCVSRVNDLKRYQRDLKNWRMEQEKNNGSSTLPEPSKPWELYGPDSLTKQLEAELDFTFAHLKSDGSESKIRLHTSVLSGETATGTPTTRVIFYRSHLGSVGNLLSHILLSRKSNVPLVFVGDLSSSNKITDPKVAARVPVIYAGCVSHARRAFKRHLEQDYENCLEALDYFRAIYQLEEMIEDGRQHHKANMRQNPRNGSLSFWNDLKTLCQTMTERWSPSTALGEAARYVLNNFNALTHYCNDLRIPPSNDLSERLLRYEKLMDRSSFGRETIEGRARYDIIRSFWQTCVFAKIDPTIALLEVLITPEATVAKNAKDYLPSRLAVRVRQDKERAALLEKIMRTSDLAELISYKLLDPNVPRSNLDS
jgi:hypothetical protein